MQAVLVLASLIAILTTLGIVLSLLFESLRFFRLVPPDDFLFGLSWSPQTALRADQAGSSGAFGVHPIVQGHDVDRWDHRDACSDAARADVGDLSLAIRERREFAPP